MRGFVVIVVMLAAVRAQAQPAPTATTVLANVEKSYAGTQQLTTEFRQYVTSASSHTTSTADGSLWLLRPGSYRFDYRQSSKSNTSIIRTVIDDGTTSWDLDHEHRRLIKNPGLNPAFAPALAFFKPVNLSTQFNVALNPSSRFSRTGSVVLELTPKQASTGTQMLTFVVNTADWRVTESIAVDDAGNTNDFSFNNTSLTRPVHASLFQVDPSRLRHYKIVTPTVASPGTNSTPPPTSSAPPAGPTP